MDTTRRLALLLIACIFVFAGPLNSLKSQDDPFSSSNDDPFGSGNGSTEEFIRLESIRFQLPAAELVQLICDGNAFDDAELVPKQKEQIKAIQQKYVKELKDLLGEEHVSDKLEWSRFKNLEWSTLPKGAKGKYGEIKSRCKREFLNVLLPVQLKKLDNLGLIHGLPRISTQSALSEILDLSEEQKRKIQVESNKLAKEIEDFAHETRKRSAEISLKYLTEKQRQKLFEIYGKPQINRAMSMAQLRYIFRQHLFTDKPPKDSRDLPKGKHVDWTPLNLDDIVKKKR